MRLGEMGVTFLNPTWTSSSRLLQDANLSSDAHNQALVSVKTQLAQTEALLKQERGEMAMIKVRAQRKA